MIENYEIISVLSDRKNSFGELDKNKRICRFCRKTVKDGISFVNKAHAISEALGNTSIFLNEECDECNSFFDREIERDLIKYLDIYRIFFKVKNKDKKIPILKGKNFEIKNIDGDNIIIKRYVTNEEITNYPIPLNNSSLITNESIKSQNIYKCLVKFALSIIESENMEGFENTIKWIKGEREIERLPQVGIIASYSLFYDKPAIMTYIRRSKDLSLPFAFGEYHFKFLTFIFIIPVFNQEEEENYKEYFSRLIDIFPAINAGSNLVFCDFSDNKSKELIYNLEFNKVEV